MQNRHPTRKRLPSPWSSKAKEVNWHNTHRSPHMIVMGEDSAVTLVIMAPRGIEAAKAEANPQRYADEWIKRQIEAAGADGEGGRS